MTRRKVLEPWPLVVVTGGLAPPTGWGDLVASGATVVGADGGARHAVDEGVTLTHLVGDFDSLTPGEVEDFAHRGTVVHRHSVDKDETDFELALELARQLGGPGRDREAARLLVVGGSGGRIDHELANVAALAVTELAGMYLTALLGGAVVQVASAHRAVALIGSIGQVASLIPLGGTARGVTTRGLRFALDREDLWSGRTRGVSNVIDDDGASVRVSAGTVAVVEPDGARNLLDKRSRK